MGFDKQWLYLPGVSEAEADMCRLLLLHRARNAWPVRALCCMCKPLVACARQCILSFYRSTVSTGGDHRPCLQVPEERAPNAELTKRIHLSLLEMIRLVGGRIK